MKIEPAHVNQLRRANDGRMVEISEDAGNVAADLKAIDRYLKVRFAEAGRPPFWAVYHESEDGRETHLVLTCQAVQNASGVWEGLDQRVVRRIMQIGHSSYDYTAEIDAANRRAEAAKHEKFRAKVEESGEQAAHALRRDMGWKGRAFIK